MTVSVIRPCFTTQHQTCKTKTETTVWKTKTKTDFLVLDRSCPKTGRSQTTSPMSFAGIGWRWGRCLQGRVEMGAKSHTGAKLYRERNDFHHLVLQFRWLQNLSASTSCCWCGCARCHAVIHVSHQRCYSNYSLSIHLFSFVPYTWRHKRCILWNGLPAILQQNMSVSRFKTLLNSICQFVVEKIN